MIEQWKYVKEEIAPASDSKKGGHGVIENVRNCGPGFGYRFSYRWIPEGEDDGGTQKEGSCQRRVPADRRSRPLKRLLGLHLMCTGLL